MAGPTPTTPIRVPRLMWAAYGRVCARLGRDRTEDLTSHIRRQVTRHRVEPDLRRPGGRGSRARRQRSSKGGGRAAARATPARRRDTAGDTGAHESGCIRVSESRRPQRRNACSGRVSRTAVDARCVRNRGGSSPPSDTQTG